MGLVTGLLRERELSVILVDYSGGDEVSLGMTFKVQVRHYHCIGSGRSCYLSIARYTKTRKIAVPLWAATSSDLSTESRSARVDLLMLVCRGTTHDNIITSMPDSGGRD